MTAPHYQADGVTVWHGDCLDILRELPDCSVDAVVTDPPYGLEFMGKDWDSFAPERTKYHGERADTTKNISNDASKPSSRHRVSYAMTRPTFRRCSECGRREFSGTPCECPDPTWTYEQPAGTPTRMAAFQSWCQSWAVECLRVLKPGGHMAAFGGTRTWHRLACAVEDAGFEIRDTLCWLYGSGFPKSLDVGKAIDKAVGAEREVVGVHPYADRGRVPSGMQVDVGASDAATITAPATPEAQQWQGWGTALKPGYEPIILARKPLTGTVAANVVEHGTGALNIDACRIEMDPTEIPQQLASRAAWAKSRREGNTGEPGQGDAFMASITGDSRTGYEPVTVPTGRWPANVVLDQAAAHTLDQHSGEASRFMYTAKADSSERPHYYRPSCDCENSWPTTPPAMATAATTTGDDSNTSKSGNSTTADPSPTGTRSITSTETRPTTDPPTSSPSPRLNTSASTQDASTETVNGGNPAASAASTNGSAPTTGTSALRDGRSTAGAGHATSGVWSQRSVCGECGASSRRESHSTVKPLDLMRWLIRLTTPPGGLVLDPFAGSGTTIEACLIEHFTCIAIEREADYLPLIEQRITKPIEVTLL